MKTNLFSHFVEVVVAALLVMVATFPETGIAQSKTATPYILSNARVFDVEAGSVSEKTTSLLISGNRIQEIANAFDNDGRLAKIDLQGQIVMPGLIDLHSHLLLYPYNKTNWNDQVLKESLELRTIRGTVAAKATLAAGFTTLRDLGTEGAAFADVALRDAIKQNIIPGPRIFAVTRALVTTGGYGPQGFDPRWDMPIGAQTADGVAQCRKVVRQQIAAGADWIKVYADYRRRAGDASTPTFSQEELNAIVDEAKSAGVPVAAHAATDLGIRRSVKAGVKTIEHGYAASLETLRLMKENNVVLCPTLMASESIARYGGWNPETDPDHPRVTAAKALMKNAIQSGVTIACGSDVGVFAHGDNARELELMFAYGMPIEDVIRSATSIAADVLDQEDLGQVLPGMLADLIVVAEDPTTSLGTLREPKLVIKDGVIEFNRLGEATIDPETTDLDSSLTADARQNGSSDTAETGSDNQQQTAPQLEIHVRPDGTYVVDGNPVSPGDLSRMLVSKVQDGLVHVRVVVDKQFPLEKLLAISNWIKQRDVRQVSLARKK